MISFQLGQAQGNFPAVFTCCVRAGRPIHMCGAEELSSGAASVVEIHKLLFSSLHPRFRTLLPEIGEGGGAFSLLLVWMKYNRWADEWFIRLHFEESLKKKKDTFKQGYVKE